MRSNPMFSATALAALLMPAATATAAEAPPSAPSREVFAWVVGETGFDSPRFARVVRIDGLEAGTAAARIASLPEGRRAAYSVDLLKGLVGDTSDRVVVGGRITDHAGPWIDGGSKRLRGEAELLAKELASRGVLLEALLLGGENPLSAESLDTADDLVWMAIRNDRRFGEIASADLTLSGAMTPASPQWRAWNEFADTRVAKAIDENLAATLRATNGSLVVAVPATIAVERGEPVATTMSLRLFGAFGGAGGGASSGFDVLAGELERAVKATRGGAVEPWIRPYGAFGSRGARSALAGTPLWDELVRHAVMFGGGRVVYVEDRSGDAAASDASRFAAVLDGIAEAWSADATVSGAPASIRRGQGFVAVGMPTVGGEVLWRVSFAPGIGGVDGELDGTGLRIERRRGESGAWLRTAADSKLEFFDRAFTQREATTGGGLLAGPVAKPSARQVAPLLSGGPAGGALDFAGLSDLNGDGVVDGADLAIQLAGGGWGGVGDLNGDGAVDGADMAIHLSGGPDQGTWNGAGWSDLNGDGVVDGADLSISLAGGGDRKSWNGAGWDDLNGDGVSDGADLAITLAGGGSGASGGDLSGGGAIDGVDPSLGVSGRVSIRKPDVAGRPKIVDGGVSTVDSDPGSTAEDGGSAAGGTPPSSGGSIPTVDPTTPVTPPAGDTGDPGASRPNLPIPVLLSDSLLETAGTSLYVSPGTTESILAAGGVPARVVYQSIDPTASQGLISVEHVVTWVESHWGADPTGWFILDYEVPHFTNLSKGLQNPQDPSFIQTRDSFITALRDLKARFPRTRWSIYGMPSLPSWFAVNGSNHTHVSIPLTDLVPILEQRRGVYQAIIDECDFLCPTIYDRHDERNSPTPAAATQSVQNTRLRNERVVILSKQMVANSERPGRPVLPFVNLWFAPGGIGEDYRLIPRDQVRAKQIEPAVAAGADSFVVWTAAGFYARLTTMPDQPSNQEQQQVRAAFAADLLDGVPASWQSLAVRQEIVDDYAAEILAVLETIVEVRAAAAASPE